MKISDVMRNSLKNPEERNMRLTGSSGDSTELDYDFQANSDDVDGLIKSKMDEYRDNDDFSFQECIEDDGTISGMRIVHTASGEVEWEISGIGDTRFVRDEA